MKLLSLLMVFLMGLNVQAADFDAQAVFGYSPGHDVDAALKRAAKVKKKVVLFSYDPKDEPGYPGLAIKYHMDQQETRKLVKENFIVVVLTRGHKDLERYPSPGAKEKAYYVVINPDGKTAKTDMVYGNGNAGLKDVKEWLAMP